LEISWYVAFDKKYGSYGLAVIGVSIALAGLPSPGRNREQGKLRGLYPSVKGKVTLASAVGTARSPEHPPAPQKAE
jgi:hypothetical protein